MFDTIVYYIYNLYKNALYSKRLCPKDVASEQIVILSKFEILFFDIFFPKNELIIRRDFGT